MTGLIKMVVFDLDGVLTDIESSWQTIHRAFGVDNEENFQKHLRGEIDYKEFMKSDIGLWGRLHISEVRKILEQVPLMDGAIEAVKALRGEGIKIAIISSGISILAERVGEELGIDLVFSNELLTDEEGNLTGEAVEVVNLRNKGAVLEELCRTEGIKPEECAVVGDSRFDVPLFEKAGLSIAFNPKEPITRESADVVIDVKDLRGILPWIISCRKAEAYISFRYEKEGEAEVIVKAVSPDNYTAPHGLIINTYRVGLDLKTRLFCTKSYRTMLATIDDLLRSIQLAEKTVRVISEACGRQTF